MAEFLLGLASSLATTALVAAVGWLLSRRARRLVLRLLGRATGLGVERVYRTQRSASTDIAADIPRGEWLRVLAGRGGELTRETFQPLWTGTEWPLRAVEILLPDPEPGRDTWLAAREDELRARDPGFRPGLLGEQVRLNAAYLAEAAKGRDHCEIRFYNLPNLFRVVMTDKVAYLTLYLSTAHGRNSPCIVARRPGHLYDFAARVFASAWEAGRPAPREPVRRP
ncbi:hypothetical protein ACFPZ0_06350 [Streptomonospora nanhaiensis]|uniref:Uncharacterized protein n=1 Tax=Streptomonospora nanhaiensis TaxID=1323731 RepID=A0A853BIZ6_9ACTN|nr:hypothetical protein [Streptomonospora nanhaiensis]MBV2365866.1 hypothetical protein [Streptomonospora nanhaiensis]MBX9387599.1 hypothetical protein [Streptomonospora nanhaiensis]NYI95243.1 hypothetical protein [Streptomonospora nanhaiensis]